MSQSLTLDVKGLYTYSSDVAGVPAGTLSIADNVNITRMNILEPRRGFEYQYNGANVLTFGSSSDRVKKFVFWKETNYIHYASTFALFSGSGVSSRGSLVTPTNATSIRDVSFSNKNLYLTNSTGILKTDAVATSLYAVGIPAGLSISTRNPETTGTAVATNKYVSYRYVLGRTDANGNTVLGAPSGRTTFFNDPSLGVTVDVILLCDLPANLDTSYFIQIYRTAESSTKDTGEEFYLVQERQLSSTNGLSLTLDNIERTNNIASIQCTKDHNLVDGQKVTITVPSNTSFNGTYSIRIDTPNSFQYTQTGTLANVASTATTGSVTTGGDIADQAAYLIDITPASLTGSTLYTSPSQEGAVNANYPPPLASDIAEYQNCMWFADTEQKHSLSVELITSQPYLGTSITIGAETFTGKRVENYDQRQFKITAPRALISTIAIASGTVTVVTAYPHELVTGDHVDVVTLNYPNADCTNKAVTVVNDTTFTHAHGTGTQSTVSDAGYVNILYQPGTSTAVESSPSLRIFYTAESLIKAINYAPSGAYYAYGLSTSDAAFPGDFLIQSRSLGSSQFTVTSNYANNWQPTLSATATNSQKSQNDAFRNGLMWSKPDQPESVPLKNIFRVGSADDPIKRIWAARDALFVFKERDGLWIIRGETEANWTKNQLDVTAKMYAPDSLASVNNTLYALMEAGICEISDTGVNVLSFPIRDQLFTAYTTYSTDVKAKAFGIGNDTEGKYILSLPQGSSSYTEKQICFDVYSRIFCGNWTLNSTAGRLNQFDQKIYLAPNENKIKKEIRSFEATDFVDEYQTLSISSIDGTGLILTLSTVAGIAVNDVIKQGSIYAYILAVDNAQSKVTVDMVEAWTTSTANVVHYKALDVKVEWNSEFAGNPAGFKHFYELNLLQKSSFLVTSTFYFHNDINGAENSISVVAPSYSGNWGDFTWGDEVWGGDPSSNTPVRLGVPRTHARCSQLRVRWEHKVAYSWFQVQGISLSFNPTSTRITRNAP